MEESSVRRFNLFGAPVEYDPEDPPGYRAGVASIAPVIGGAMLAGKVYELPPGQSNTAYHYELSDEEWLIVLRGRPSVRHPAGEQELVPGDVVCFPTGPAGAHKVTNRSEETARLAIVSTQRLPAVVVYPDSDKVGVYTGGDGEEWVARRESAVDYWDREPLGEEPLER